MQLSIANKALSLVKGTYLEEHERKEYKLIITDTYSIPVTITAKDLNAAKKVAEGLYKLGLIEKDPGNQCLTIDGISASLLRK